MATPRVGRAAFQWSDSLHLGTERLCVLGTRLYNVRPSDARNRVVADSLDLSAREVIVYGTAALNVITADIRLHDNPQELVDLIAAGKDGQVLTYYPNFGQPGESYQVYLLDGSVRPDPDTAGWAQYMATVTLRAVSGSLERIMYLDRLLFKYVPGMDLSSAEFERADPANYTDVNGDTQSAGVDVARDGHYQTVDGVWTRTLRMDVSTSEVCYFPFAHDPQDLTIYIKAVERGTISTASARYWGIGGGTGSGSSCIVLYQVSGTTIGIAHNNSADGWNTGGTIATSHSAGEVLEACVTFDVTNAEMRLYAAVDGGAISASSALALTSIASAWETDILTLNAWGSAGATDQGAVDVVEFKVAAGVQSMSTIRSL